MSKVKQANEQIKKGKYEEALQLLFDAIEEKPNNPIAYINAGNLLATLNKREEAERFFLQAIEKDETTATAYVSLGNLYYDEGLFAEAERLLQRAISLQIEDAHTYYLLGMTHVKRDQFILSLPFLQRAVELGANPEQTLQYGLMLAKLGYETEAQNVFEQILEQRPEFADAMYNLAIIYLKQDKKIQRAERYLQDVLRINPNHTLAKEAKEQLQKRTK